MCHQSYWLVDKKASNHSIREKTAMKGNPLLGTMETTRETDATGKAIELLCLMQRLSRGSNERRESALLKCIFPLCLICFFHRLFLVSRH